MEPEEHDPDHVRFVSQLTQCQSSLTLYVRALMPGDRAANDVVQQANVKIWEKRGDFQPGTHFTAWALTIARYEVLNYRKRCARDARLKFSDELETTIANELAELDDDLAERHEALKQCLSELKPDGRDLLFLRYQSDETLVDFAHRVGRSANGLKVKLHRLRASLGRCIEQRLLARGASS